jgi:hypothetical protein
VLKLLAGAALSLATIRVGAQEPPWNGDDNKKRKAESLKWESKLKVKLCPLSFSLSSVHPRSA